MRHSDRAWFQKPKGISVSRFRRADFRTRWLAACDAGIRKTKGRDHDHSAQIGSDRYFAPAAGKVSLVTGSTSGIGLGIARALAAAGSDVVLNGLGHAVEINKTKEQIAAECGVKLSYSAADMSTGGDRRDDRDHTC